MVRVQGRKRNEEDDWLGGLCVASYSDSPGVAKPHTRGQMRRISIRRHLWTKGTSIRDIQEKQKAKMEPTGLEHTTHSSSGPCSPFKLVGVLVPVPLVPLVWAFAASLLPTEKGVSERCPAAVASLPFPADTVLWTAEQKSSELRQDTTLWKSSHNSFYRVVGLTWSTAIFIWN